MKIAITSMGNDLDSIVDHRFGRAAYILIVESETLEFEVINNKENANAKKNAGINSAKTIIKKEAKILLTGSCGPKAFKALKEAKVKVIQHMMINFVKDAIKIFNEGKLVFASHANVKSHWK